MHTYSAPAYIKRACGFLPIINPNNFWIIAKQASIQTSDDIRGNFDLGFDKQVPEDTKQELRSFVSWVEDNFSLPITLWVDFEYKHYLIGSDGRHAGYLFCWADFASYPVFSNRDDIPQIRLPVRTEHSTINEILTSFIEAITDYFVWINDLSPDNYKINDTDVEEILQAYLESKE